MTDHPHANQVSGWCKENSLPGLIDKKVLANHVSVDHKLSSDVNQAICLYQACSGAQQCWLWNDLMSDGSQAWCSHIHNLVACFAGSSSQAMEVELNTLELAQWLAHGSSHDCILSVAYILAVYMKQRLFIYTWYVPHRWTHNLQNLPCWHWDQSW